jgi:hypothetical protein
MNRPLTRLADSAADVVSNSRALFESVAASGKSLRATPDFGTVVSTAKPISSETHIGADRS